MSTINLRSLKKVVAGTTVAVAIAAALSFAHNDSIARDLGASKAATTQNANLGDGLPVSLGGGIAPILW
jgi:hypothetical protein